MSSYHIESFCPLCGKKEIIWYDPPGGNGYYLCDYCTMNFKNNMKFEDFEQYIYLDVGSDDFIKIKPLLLKEISKNYKIKIEKEKFLIFERKESENEETQKKN